MCRYRVKGRSCLTWNSHFVLVLTLRASQNYFAGLRVKSFLASFLVTQLVVYFIMTLGLIFQNWVTFVESRMLLENIYKD